MESCVSSLYHVGVVEYKYPQNGMLILQVEMALSGVIVCILGLALSSLSVNGRPATFSQDFRVAWADSHVRQLDGGRAIQLTLDQSSGITIY